ncbi:MAG: hypothetical protein A2355_14615 [Spirochaetes bacterium RIFOXYB1_FULL_32_8]|nr:MAG: hypothetical protein A2355_14615 [Spirochaetes bacterium RIFOXYB1_FULL_32_8]HBI37380.1 hypothetical protein [Spirochaetia bacterium]
MVLVLKKTIKVVVVDEHGIKIKYNQLENNGLRLLPLEKVIQLEKNKELIAKEYLSKIVDIDEHNIYFSNGLTNVDFVALCVKYFGFVNYNDIRNESGNLIYIYIFDLCQITITKKSLTIKTSINIYWDI